MPKKKLQCFSINLALKIEERNCNKENFMNEQ